MENFPRQHFLYRLNNCEVRQWPYPHLYLEKVFPDDFYAEILAHLPAEEFLSQIGEIRGKALKKYPERFAFALDGNSCDRLPEASGRFWGDFGRWLRSPGVVRAISLRFGLTQRLRADILLCRDRTNYSLGPHTDATSKVIALLFYLPRYYFQGHLGTSIYVPKPDFLPNATDHHSRDGFDRVATMPYLPNSLFGFLRSDHSFHGVEPITDDTQRWLLQYNLYAA